ncbi:hypothetical protein IR012_23495 [Pseudomonas putida]|uniref:hypothetical protein n=1 Tax=Pseudomonas putida TaxID=303 RepID=UPI0018ABA196|nr:hypothetical protein [Pseudomonas putida]MBF8670827.1 hypothetical protein [Pseudomonas putida]MBF8715276.1 hypothetical protein [Pseudomonas putida]
MKKIAFIILLATAGLVQVAHANDADSSEQPQAGRAVIMGIGVPEPECPEGTYPTPIGECQPDFEP